MRLIRGISLDFRKDVGLEPMEPIEKTGFDTVFAVIESEVDEAGIGRIRDSVKAFQEQGVETVAYLADGSWGLRCLSEAEEIHQKVQRIQHLATIGVSGVIFRGFGTSCYFCERCASSLERATGLKLPPAMIGNAEEAGKWRYPDPFVHGFDSPYNRSSRLEEVLQIEAWMGDGLNEVASRIATAVAKVHPACRLGLVGLSPIGRKVIEGFSGHSVPIVVVLANTYMAYDELEIYIRKFPFEGLDRRWSSLVATSAYYHTPEELNRILLRAGIEGRYGVIVWASGGVQLSFGRLEDMTDAHWGAVRRAFQVIRSYEEACEEAESASGLYWTRKGGAHHAGLD